MQLKSKITSLLFASSLAVSVLPATQATAQDPFLGEVRLMGFNFCPRGWTDAAGQLLPISQNTALFSLYGTIYGGDGRTTFGLPDLRGRAPINSGQGAGLQNYAIGQRGGAENFALTSPNQLPAHSHTVNATNQIGNKNGPGTDYLAVPDITANIYHEGPHNRTMDPGMISNTGASAAVSHRGPYLAMNWCVALQGVFPSRS